MYQRVDCIGNHFLIPHIGARRFFILLIAGQMMMAIVVSHFGMLESPQDPVTVKKKLGVGLVLASVMVPIG